jgi:hypothetical protein
MAISNCMSSNIEYFTIGTLVDITATGVTRNKPGDEHKRNQQRNWETVLQVLGIRAQPTLVEGPMCGVVDEDLLKRIFGEMYTGEQRVWFASFSIEHRDVYKKDAEQLALLADDFNQVPVVTGLDETARFILPIFYCHGAIRNIIFKPGLLGELQ